MIDIQRLLEDENIQFWIEGKNVADGFINVQCPHCDDSHNHGGFSLDGSTYICWRCGRHDVYGTIALLLQKTIKETSFILRDYKTLKEHEYVKKVYHNTTIEIPGNKLLQVHKNYLKSRGLDADLLQNKYRLRGTLVYKDWLYSYRIIIPIIYKGKEVSYIARDYTGRQERYMLCKPENEIIFHKDILFNLDNCNYREAIVVEGTFDAMNVGDNCCATFGIKYLPEQLRLLRERFDTIYVMFDGEPQAQEAGITLCKEFQLMGGKAINICLDKGDAGDMTKEEVKELKKDLNL